MRCLKTLLRKKPSNPNMVLNNGIFNGIVLDTSIEESFADPQVLSKILANFVLDINLISRDK
jgi:hypothetical protein